MSISDNGFSIGGAVGAYRNNAIRTAGAPAEGPSFENMVRTAAQQTVDTIRAGENAAIAGLTGEMSMQDVVQATMEMETVTKTTVAIRDKLVEAYQEVLRMSV